MGTNPMNASNVIQIAIDIEKHGYQLYKHMSKKGYDEFTRNILLFLAEQEMQHIEGFTKLYERVVGQKSIMKAFDLESENNIKALRDSLAFYSVDYRQDAFQTIQEALDFAVQCEKDSILFYTEIVQYFEDQDALNLFEVIIEEEKVHLVRLQEINSLVQERGIDY